jgi:hypothetical protein
MVRRRRKEEEEEEEKRQSRIEMRSGGKRASPI